MTTTRYFEDLAEILRASGVPAERATAMIEELEGYLGEAGTTPEEEFGPVRAFAEQLTATASSPDTPGPSGADESWAFHADVFNEMKLLEQFGDQGWEVVSYDIVKGFDCRRSLELPQRWEYRREAVPPGRIQAVRARLAEDGWEPAADYGFWRYFKRPVAATTGPAAELATPPAVPPRRFYWSRTFAVSGSFYIALTLIIAAVISLIISDSDSRLSTLAGALTGITLVLACGAAFVLYQRRKARR